MESIWPAETDFGSHPARRRSRPPSSTVLDTQSIISAGARNGSVHVGWDTRCIRVWSSNLSTQFRRTQTRNTTRISTGAYYCSEPQTIARFDASSSGDDCTPHRARTTKSSESPCLTTANTFISYGLAISSCVLTSISTIPVISATALDKSCKWPKWHHFIETDIQPHFILFL